MKKKMERLHSQLCKELGITPTKITMNDGGWGTTGGWYDGRTQKIYVNPSRDESCFPWKKRSWKWVMAHETYHHYQACKGWLTPKAYKGVAKAWYKERGSWSTYPWERAANLYADKVARKKGWKC
jgi:hypothetical protein